MYIPKHPPQNSRATERPINARLTVNLDCGTSGFAFLAMGHEGDCVIWAGAGSCRACGWMLGIVLEGVGWIELSVSSHLVACALFGFICKTLLKQYRTCSGFSATWANSINAASLLGSAVITAFNMLRAVALSPPLVSLWIMTRLRGIERGVRSRDRAALA